jgi:hypothetical protein
MYFMPLIPKPVMMLVPVLAGAVILAPAQQLKPGFQEQKVKIPSQLPIKAQEMLDINRQGMSDWNKTSVSPSSLVVKCDTWLANLKDVSAKTRYLYQYGIEGQFGVMTGDVAIVNSRKFRADFAHYGLVKHEYGIHAGGVTADGLRFQRHDERGWSHPVQVAAPRLPKSLLIDWVKNCQELIFAGLGTGQHPLTALYDAAKAAGLRTVAERRSFSVGDKKFSEFRVLISGITMVSGRKAHCDIELLIDAFTGAPLKITQSRQYGQDVAHRFRSYWTVAWDRSPNQIFDPTLFTVSKS